MKTYLKRIVAGEILDKNEAQNLMHDIISSDDDVLVAAIIAAITARGESIEEIVGFIKEIKSQAFNVCSNLKNKNLVDICGTGGDKFSTFNISTASALLASKMGLNIFKHGNSKVSSSCGSADVLKALNIKFSTPNDLQNISVGNNGTFKFLFAPDFHPSLKKMKPIREKLGIRTLFNFIGPLLNPVPIGYQIIGLANVDMLDQYAQICQSIVEKKIYLIHGEPGCDEATPAGIFYLRIVEKTKIQSCTLAPEDFGIPRCNISDLSGDHAEYNAKIIRDILAGKDLGPKTDAVILNTALLLMLTGIENKPINAASKVRKFLKGRL